MNYKRTKFTCYFAYLAMSSVFCLPPLLFATFRELYGISYTLLGTLVLINFCTQLCVDLTFSFFGKYFNPHTMLRVMPLLTAAGMCLYAVIPAIFPQYAYAGLVVGTLAFSISAGLAEVLVSPTVAALPSDTPDRDMSMLHSLYGYGLVGVVLISTVFLRLVGNRYWMYLTFFWAALPVVAAVLFMTSPLPPMDMSHAVQRGNGRSKYRTVGLILCMGCIFLGACAENTMSNWISVYTEKVLHMPKAWGDIFCMCLFAVLLALTRTAYAKYGKNIFRVLCLGMAGSTFCYLIVAFVQNGTVSLLACVALGVCSSMLWPGTLIFMEENVPAVGVSAYALMAAGGDLGASLAPQAVGIIVDKVAATAWATRWSAASNLSPEDIGFKVGMLAVAALPALGLVLLLYMKKYFKIKSGKNVQREEN